VKEKSEYMWTCTRESHDRMCLCTPGLRRSLRRDELQTPEGRRELRLAHGGGGGHGCQGTITSLSPPLTDGVRAGRPSHLRLLQKAWSTSPPGLPHRIIEHLRDGHISEVFNWPLQQF